jgi:high affinity sulfate transporter 1
MLPVPIEQPRAGWWRWFSGAAVVRAYDRRDLSHDLLAGVVITAFLVPVGLAYAQASGVPPVYGLYATVVPLLVYALMGPSRILVLGPDSSLAPLIAATIAPLALGDPDRAVALAGAIAIGTGLLCVAAGLARFGFVTELLSMPVRYGYLNGIAVVVIVSQLPTMLGIELDADTTIGKAVDTARAVVDGDVDAAPVLLGLTSLVGIVAVRRVLPALPGVLLAVVGSMIAVVAFDLRDRLELVGRLPGGLPSPAIPDLRWSDVGPVAIGAFTVAVVALTDTSVLSRSLAVRRGQRVDADQELVALGAANLAAGFTQGFAVSASSSRTPVAVSAGARTQLTGAVAAVLVAFLLLAAPGALRTLPTATLAAVVIAAVVELFEVGGVVKLARTRRAEFMFSMVALVGVVVLGVIWGVGLAVGISLLALIQKAWRPYTTTLVRVDGMKGYHDVNRHPEGKRIPALVLYRFDAPLFFANAELFRDEVLAAVGAPHPARWVVVTAEPITDVDATAAEMLVELHRELADDGVVLAFAELKGVVRDRLARSGTTEVIGIDHFYPTIGQAVHAYVDATGISWVDWEDEGDTTA